MEDEPETCLGGRFSLAAIDILACRSFEDHAQLPGCNSCTVAQRTWTRPPCFTSPASMFSSAMSFTITAQLQ